MANTCMARILVEPREVEPLPFPVADITRRLEHLYYECFDVISVEPDRLEIECGFRWSPPFDDLLSISADFNVKLRCLYDEDGCCFMGAYRAEDGKVLQDETIDY